MIYDVRQVHRPPGGRLAVLGDAAAHAARRWSRGIGADQRALRRHHRQQPAADRPPGSSGRKRPGGILYREGIAKISQFSRACNDDGIPIIWLQDISGFDIGVEAEKQGLLGYGSNLIYTNSTNTVPMITVLLRKASGAGYYAMAGLPYDPVRAALDADHAAGGDGGAHAGHRRLQHQARRQLPASSPTDPEERGEDRGRA